MLLEIAKILYDLKDTPLPTLLVIGGLIFLLLAFVKKVSSDVEPDPSLKKWAIILGSVLLILGIALYLVPQPQQISTAGQNEPSQSSSTNNTSEQQPSLNCASLTSAQIEQLKTAQDVKTAIQQAEKFAGYRQNDFQTNTQIPPNVVIAMNLYGEPSQFPVVAIKNEGGWGLFLTTDSFSAPNSGTYWCVQP